jgi:hypothetical protein
MVGSQVRGECRVSPWRSAAADLHTDSQAAQAQENAYLDCRSMLECHGFADVRWETRTGTGEPKGHVTRTGMCLASARYEGSEVV